MDKKRIVHYLCFCNFWGNSFHGFQTQLNSISINTVQATLQKAITRLVGKPTNIQGCSRTDVGVNALRMPFSFKYELRENHFISYLFSFRIDITTPNLQNEISEEKMVKAMNYFLGEADVSISEVRLVDEKFDIGKNILRKNYSYLLLPNQPILTQKNIFFKKMCSWQMEEALDVDKLRMGIEKFVGTHNFFNFTVKRPGYTSVDQYKRRIDNVYVNTSNNLFHPYNPDLIELGFLGPGFLTYQIRYMVAALVDLCLDKIKIEDLEKALKLEQNNYNKYRAPANGLFLKDVELVDDKK